MLSGTKVLRNFFIQKKKQVCFSNEEGKECIAPLFQTVQETPQPIPTNITGTIPKWIQGSLLRNGPGKFEIGDHNFNHWFDGMALMHKFAIADGNVTYMSKFLQSNAYMSNESENRIVVSEFGTLETPDPCKSLFQRFISTFEIVPKPTDNGSINFVKYKKDYCVSTETNLMRKVDPVTLQTKEEVNWTKYIAVNGATAHPHYDPCGTAYNMGNSYGKHGSFYNIIKVPAQESEDDILQGAVVVCSIPAVDKWNPSYYHSFGMTENYVVFIEQPVKISILRIATGKIRGLPISDCLSWDPNCDTIFHVANKHTGKLHSVTYHTEGLAMFHQINAYEDQDCIVLDLCCQDSGNLYHLYKLQNLRKSGKALDEVYSSMSKSLPRRFVLPLNIDPNTPQNINISPLEYTTATAVMHDLGKVWCTHDDLYNETFEAVGSFEFPAINYSKYNTKKYRYFYGCGLQHLVGSSLIKMDVVTKEMKIWQEDSFYPSEPVFLPSPYSNEEDDGVILSAVVTPRQDKTTFLLILDAKTFTEIARAEIPVQMPYGFHGIFLPQK